MHTSSSVMAFAYYLPQYYPVPLNSHWWGAGYTEWNAVLTVHKGVRSPSWAQISPGELGFYDLRLKSVRQKQGLLARLSGLSAFAIYHYYSNGNRPMAEIVDRILQDGEPAFPFFLCWANHDWTLAWRGRSDIQTFKQEYSEHESDDHLEWLLSTFQDPRYFQIDGSPVLAIYSPQDVVDNQRVFHRWRRAAVRAGFSGLIVLGVANMYAPPPPEEVGVDAWIQSPGVAVRDLRPLERFRSTRIRPRSLLRFFKYRDYEIKPEAFRRVTKLQRRRGFGPMVPTVLSSWNNVGRRVARAWYLRHDPESFRHLLTDALEDAPALANVASKPRLVCINAWNEWGEMMAVEPSAEAGRAMIEVMASVLGGSTDPGLVDSAREGSTSVGDHVD